MAADLATLRNALQDRLNTLPDPLHAYDVMQEQVRLPRVMIIYPQPNRSGSWWATACADGVLVYRFLIEIWVDRAAGLERAQDVLDAYLSPSGTNDNSVEGKLEDRTIDDDLTTNTTSVNCGQFTRYGYGSLEEHQNLLVATFEVELLVDAS